MYIFGYGSLLNRPSAENALKRPLTPEEMIQVRLCGFRRSWAEKEWLYFESLKREAWGVFLDLDSDESCSVNGVVVRINERELEQLKLREKNYDCVEVTDGIEGVDLDAPVYTFVAKPEGRIREGEEELYVPQRYIDMIRSGCEALGEEFLKSYELSTDPVRLPVAQGSYRFVDPVQAQYV